MATPLSQITATSSPSSSHAVPTASHPLYTIPPPPYTPTDSIAPAPTASVSGGASTSGSSGPGQPVETAVSFIAFLGIVIAILYTIHKVRRDRRLRRLALEGDQSHLENGGVHRGTNRPEDVDEGKDNVHRFISHNGATQKRVSPSSPPLLLFLLLLLLLLLFHLLFQPNVG